MSTRAERGHPEVKNKSRQMRSTRSTGGKIMILTRDVQIDFNPFVLSGWKPDSDGGGCLPAPSLSPDEEFMSIGRASGGLGSGRF